jgi:hypothetical protein
MAKRPSSWVNFQDYLGLNQDQGAEMGQRLVADVGAQASKAGQEMTSAEREYGYRVGAGTLGGPDDNAFVNGKNSNLYGDGEAAAKAEGGYTGPQSLDDLNPDLYGDVKDAVSRVKNAQDPNMIGTELAKAYGGQAAGGAGGSALDAFLTGQTSSAELSGLNDSYGGLMDSLGIAEKDAGAQADAATTKSQAAAQRWADLAAGKTEGAAASGDAPFKPGGYADLRSFMDSGSAGQYAHEAAMYASPVDWITRGLGELGYDGQNVSELGAKVFGADGTEASGTGDFTIGNLRSGARLVQDQYGPDALNAWFKALTPESWKQLMGKGNAGAQARVIRAWLSEHGYQRLR